ncbi:hypothetical protein RAS_04910 [Rickettsia asiatica]|uniref:CHAT domain-containing protein n=1 Tax=Rickettsia asiatica TaxID=238800 RepID=A0A510G6X3_9RICK|nr:C13 family peptidase [Rickettsia asiatica]BBJ31382.1 hypothetical protein RAS_04910 [Rickettsia asiatica]
MNNNSHNNPDNTMPLAVIITVHYDNNSAFNKNRGYFKANKQQLLNGYKVIEIDDIASPRDIENILKDIPPDKIVFFWLRGHGEAKSIRFSEQNYLLSQEVEEIFHWLPNKLQAKAILYLESCSTGSLENDFYNNIQFSFAKLTKP